MGVYIQYTPRLPSEYQEVEWIQSSGTQYIDTGYTPKTTSEFEVKFQNVSAINTYRTILGTRQDSGNNSFWIGWQNGKSYSQFSPTNSEVSSSNGWFNTGVDYTLEFKNKNLVNNGTTVVSSINFTQNANYTLYLFSGHAYNKTNPFEPSATKIYYCKLREGGTLVRNFIPCYRKSDSVIGLYDLVNSVFYTNSGTGTFSKGNDVTMSELKNAYIGEVYEYSYDFRNKSSTILTNDGWSILKGTPVFDSNGISCSGANTAIAKNIGNSVFANANKITMEYNFKLNSSSDTGFLICQTATSSSTVGNTGLYATSGSNLRQTSIFGTSTNISGMGSGTYKGTITLDLVGKTYTAEMTGKTTQTGTLTDTQISNIRNNIQVIRISATNTSNTGIQDMYLCVE